MDTNAPNKNVFYFLLFWTICVENSKIFYLMYRLCANDKTTNVIQNIKYIDHKTVDKPINVADS